MNSKTEVHNVFADQNNKKSYPNTVIFMVNKKRSLLIMCYTPDRCALQELLNKTNSVNNDSYRTFMGSW